MKFVFMLLFASTCIATLAQNNATITRAIPICYSPEIGPEFPGGIHAMYKWLGKNLVYPPEAKNKRIWGKVYVKFLVGIDGKTSAPQIIKRRLNEQADVFDEEVKRLILNMPMWKPAMLNGENVVTHFTMPISFKLN